MSIDFRLPDVGEGLSEAEVVRWLVEPGGAVKEDQEFLEIETDKAVVGITSPVTGTLVAQNAAVGDLVEVGTVVAVFASSADADVAPATSAPSPVTGSVAGDAAVASTPPAVATPAGRPSSRPKATPATRKLARELGVDLYLVTGTGPGGRVMDDDVRAAASVPPAPAAQPVGSDASRAAGSAAQPTSTSPSRPSEDQRIPIRGVRRAVVRTMTESWNQIPHVNAMQEVDFSRLLAARAELGEKGIKVPLSAFLVKAAAIALAEYPVFNAEVDTERDEIVLKARINIGVAIDTPDGLIVPVVHDADRLGIREIGDLLVGMVTQAQERTLPQEFLRGGSFTVNNYGPLGGWFGTSLIKPPEVGILSLGPARESAVVRDGQIVARPIAAMALAADHRVADGREIVGFCTLARELLESPMALALGR